MTADDAFPTFPPGLWRRILLQPGSGWIGAALEDDMHRFNLRIDHAEGRITKVSADALRTPWSACPGATGFIERELSGQPLADVARRDPSEHCTHLLDLAILCAAHADDTRPLRLDMRIADRVDDRTTATLKEDGMEKLRWRLEGTVIAGPDPHTGKDLRRLSQWKRDLPARDAERATVLRRAVFISGGRQFDPPPGLKVSDMGPERMGVCFNYQMPQAGTSVRKAPWRVDFSTSGDQPLAGFEAEQTLSAMG